MTPFSPVPEQIALLDVLQSEPKFERKASQLHLGSMTRTAARPGFRKRRFDARSEFIGACSARRPKIGRGIRLYLGAP
jgi:hypothetical protein